MASGAGDIFGTAGGVMEATLRAASEFVTGKPAERSRPQCKRSWGGARAAGDATIRDSDGSKAFSVEPGSQVIDFDV